MASTNKNLPTTNNLGPTSSNRLPTMKEIIIKNPETIHQECVVNYMLIDNRIKTIILEAQEGLAAYKHATKEMIIRSSDMIIKKYSHLSMDDVRLCMMKIVSGEYFEIIQLDIERIGKGFKLCYDDTIVVAIKS